MVLVRSERPGRPSSSHALAASATVYVREDRGARPSSSRSSAMALQDRRLRRAGHPPADPVPVGVEPEAGRAPPASYAVTVELGVSALVALPVLEDAPRVAGTPGIEHLGLHHWDHLEPQSNFLKIHMCSDLVGAVGVEPTASRL